MAHLIDKDALVAEIERRRNDALMRQHNLEAIGQDTIINEIVANELNRILLFINTLEVKEVNLKKEQLEELDIVSRGFASSRAEILESLYNDLKKL